MTKRKGTRHRRTAIYSLYGPNDRVASKAVVAIVEEGQTDIIELQRWVSGGVDIRRNEKIQEQIGAFLQKHNVKKFVWAGRIIGCPHEEGLDYPNGQDCPFCPFWAGRDRWTGEMKK